MAGYLLKWCWDQKITPTQKLVLMALNEHAYYERGVWMCPSSHATVAALTGLTTQSICRVIADLFELGLVDFQGNVDGRRSVYVLNAPPRVQA